MNVSTTSAAGPPTTAAPPQSAAQGGGKATTKPATPFMALLAMLGSAGGTGPADGGDAAITADTDVALSDGYGHATASPGHTEPDVAPAGGRKRHDTSASTPALAIGVPLTIAAIPIAGLTLGGTPAAQQQPAGVIATQSATTDATASLSSMMDITGVPSLATGASVTPPSSPAALASNIGDMKRAATLATATQSGGAATNFAPTVAISLATTPNAAAIPTVATAGQHGNAHLQQSFSTAASGIAAGTASLPPIAGAVINTAPAATPDVGVIATGNAADATNAVAATTTPGKSARHSTPDIIGAEGWGANAGAVGGSNNVSALAAPAPPHPAVSNAAQQVVAQATLLHNGQSAEMHLRLRPPDLGDVRVILRRDATGALSAHLIPATRAAGDVLNANLHHLRNALDQHSQGQRAAVSVGQHDVADQRHQQHMNGGHSSHEDEASTTHPATTAASGNQPAAQRTDRVVAINATVDYDA